MHLVIQRDHRAVAGNRRAGTGRQVRVDVNDDVRVVEAREQVLDFGSDFPGVGQVIEILAGRLRVDVPVQGCGVLAHGVLAILDGRCRVRQGELFTHVHRLREIEVALPVRRHCPAIDVQHGVLRLREDGVLGSATTQRQRDGQHSGFSPVHGSLLGGHSHGWCADRWGRNRYPVAR